MKKLLAIAIVLLSFWFTFANELEPIKEQLQPMMTDCTTERVTELYNVIKVYQWCTYVSEDSYVRVNKTLFINRDTLQFWRVRGW